MAGNADDFGGIAVDRDHLWRSDNIGRLLLHSFRVFEQRLLTGVHAMGYTSVRLMHFNVMRHVDYGGTRMAALAERAGITNGAMTQAVNTVVRDGFLTVEPDPEDGRARLVRFTPEGVRLTEVIHGLFENVQAEMAGILGEEGFATLQKLLRQLQISFHARPDPGEVATSLDKAGTTSTRS